MFPAIPASPDCAGQCSARIELVPSLRAAALAGAWLLVACVAIQFGVALPWFARLAIGIGAATFGWAGVRSACLLAGSGAVRAIAWQTDGQLRARFGSGPLETLVSLGAGSFRLGHHAFILWLESCDGIHVVVIDTGIQDADAIRRLGRRLNRGPKPALDGRIQAS